MPGLSPTPRLVIHSGTKSQKAPNALNECALPSSQSPLEISAGQWLMYTENHGEITKYREEKLQGEHKQEQNEDEVVNVKISSIQEPCASLHLSPLHSRLLALVGAWWELRVSPKETRCCPCLAAAGQKDCLSHCCPKFSRECGLWSAAPPDAAAPKPQPVWTWCPPSLSQHLLCRLPTLLLKGKKADLMIKLPKQWLKSFLKKISNKENANFPFTFRKKE